MGSQLPSLSGSLPHATPQAELTQCATPSGRAARCTLRQGTNMQQTAWVWNPRDHRKAVSRPLGCADKNATHMHRGYVQQGEGTHG
uniref:Uncharacterized protein n=1 Tax=Eutreptiella gymnastica TaxID=73025 RepID=A0A7S4LB95_9EUGL